MAMVPTTRKVQCFLVGQSYHKNNPLSCLLLLLILHAPCISESSVKIKIKSSDFVMPPKVL